MTWRSLLAITICVTGLTALPAAAQSPLGVPVPSEPSAADALSAGNGSGDGGGAVPGAGTCNSAAERGIELPADDGPHEDALEEWWFWTGHLRTRGGRRFALMAYFMSRGSWGPRMVDYAIFDIERQRFHYAREPLAAARTRRAGGGFALHGAAASAVGGNGRDRVHVEVDGYELDLVFTAVKPPVPLFGDGSDTVYCNRAYFYARPRMAIRGTMMRRGRATAVTGQGWFDHAWGFFPALAAVEWQYVQAQLPDGRDVFVGHVGLPGQAAELELGMISGPDGRAVRLRRGDFRIEPRGHWSRDATCSYPVDLRVHAPGITLDVNAAVRHAEFRAIRAPSAIALWPEVATYWDGPATVGGAAAGLGWLDLGAYCRG